MANNFNDSFLKALDRLGLKSATYKAKVLNDVLNIDGADNVDAFEFEVWFNEWIKQIDVSKITAIGRYFVSAFIGELKRGHFNSFQAPITPSASDVSDPQSIEEFENDWEEWKELLNKLNPDDGVPSKGVFSVDSNTRKVRALSDGNGGLIYIDGSISKKYPRLEDLSDDEKRDLYDAVITVHHGASYLGHFEYLLEKIRPYETAR